MDTEREIFTDADISRAFHVVHGTARRRGNFKLLLAATMLQARWGGLIEGRGSRTRRTVKCAVQGKQGEWESELGRKLADSEIEYITRKMEETPEFAYLRRRRRRKVVRRAFTLADIYSQLDLAADFAREMGEQVIAQESER